MVDSGEVSMTPEEALSSLYGAGGRNLTWDGYAPALAALRKRDPGLARRVERKLAPYLEKAFPRRSVKWQDTSQGMMARVALLPDNPHLRQDLKTVRKVLSVPEDHIKIKKGDTLWRQFRSVNKLRSPRRIIESNVASSWWNLHVIEARTNQGRSEQIELPDELRASAMAAAHADLSDKDVPLWLRRKPVSGLDEPSDESPLDWCVARLIDRHRLPKATTGLLVFYVLTENVDWLGQGEPLPFSVSVSLAVYQPYGTGALNILVQGLDEFATYEDWVNIWKSRIMPAQERSWKERGQKPSGNRGHDLKRLKEFMPVYNAMIESKTSIAKFIGKQFPSEKLDRRYGEYDQETMRRALSDIETLLTPISETRG